MSTARKELGAQLIICESVAAECASLIPAAMRVETVPFAMHREPERLHAYLQELIDKVPEELTHVLLGFGLCSNAVVGLCSRCHSLVAPRVHDCIALFCGSQERFRLLAEEEPGTLYLTWRYIESAEGTYHLMEYDRFAARFGEAEAERIIGLLLRHYRRALLLETGEYPINAYRPVAREFCKRHGLDYAEERGSRSMIERLIRGPWGGEFVLAPPGRALTQNEFLFASTEEREDREERRSCDDE